MFLVVCVEHTRNLTWKHVVWNINYDRQQCPHDLREHRAQPSVHARREMHRWWHLVRNHPRRHVGDVHIQMSNHEVNVPVFALGSRSWFSNNPTAVVEASHVTLNNHGSTQPPNLPSHTPRSMEGSLDDIIDIMKVQQAYLCALEDQTRLL
jgi:hypothetical protein